MPFFTMGKWSTTIKGASTFDAQMRTVMETARKGLEAGPVVVTLGRIKKSRQQECCYHAIIGDIASQVVFDGKRFDEAIWKSKLVDEFDEEMRLAGCPLAHPGRTAMSQDGRRLLTIIAKTSQFSVKEASEFIEFLHAKAVEYDVQLSNKTLEYYQELEEQT